MYDLAVVGGGMAGMALAARLQVAGASTVVLEAHGQPGGCAGYFRRKGFTFDVGATTLVDFEPDGVGGELLQTLGMPPLNCVPLPGYQAWLPDRTVTLYRCHEQWAAERLAQLGSTQRHRRFWKLLDEIAAQYWRISRQGAKLPIRSLGDALRAVRLLGLSQLASVRYLRWTMGDVLRHYRLRDDPALVSLLGMLIEDTVHSTIDRAPFINAALGVTIRGAGLSRVPGGMRGFWSIFTKRYRQLGGELRVGCRVERISGRRDAFEVATRRGSVAARQVASAVPARLTALLAPDLVGNRLDRFLKRDAVSEGGAAVVFLGVPEEEVGEREYTHHQLLHDYEQPLGNGNNMFVSVSAAGDGESAPAGHRSVMLSTHCELEPWCNLSPAQYRQRKEQIGTRLITLARRVYPRLGQRAIVCEVATPRTFERFTGRPRGAVGGVRQTLRNSNQHAIPHDIGVPGFFLVGDTTWPGLGTVACVLGSRIVADPIRAHWLAGFRKATPEKCSNARPSSVVTR